MQKRSIVRQTGKRYTILKDVETGIFPSRHFKGLDPNLVGERAFDSSAVKEYWEWLLNNYAPEYDVVLVTPCSNVKPYTRSPMSRKIRGMLKRLGLWDLESDKPRGMEWLYFSDLLIFVPYTYAEHYPACCYDVPPDLVVGNPKLLSLVADLLRRVLERVNSRARISTMVIYLPRKHLRIWTMARNGSSSWPREVYVKYSIFSIRELEEAIRGLGLVND